MRVAARVIFGVLLAAGIAAVQRRGRSKKSGTEKPESQGTSKESTMSEPTAPDPGASEEYGPPVPEPVHSESRPKHGLPVPPPANPKIPEPMRPNSGIYERYGTPVSSLSIPSEVDLLYPTVCVLRNLGGSGRKAELVRKVIEAEGYSHSKELMALKRRLGWVFTALKGIGVVENSSRGYWCLTKKGLTIDEAKIRSDHANYRKRIT